MTQTHNVSHYNGECCFDYGNSETDDKDDGARAMKAICARALLPCAAHRARSVWLLTHNLLARVVDFGNAHWRGNSGNQSQITHATNQTEPWVGADVESGMHYGGKSAIVNDKSMPMTSACSCRLVRLHCSRTLSR